MSLSKNAIKVLQYLVQQTNGKEGLVPMDAVYEPLSDYKNRFSTASVALRQLEDGGYVKTQRSDTDRRKHTISLTEQTVQQLNEGSELAQLLARIAQNPRKAPRRAIRTNGPTDLGLLPVPSTRAEVVALLKAYRITGDELARAHGCTKTAALAISSPRKADVPMRKSALRSYFDSIKAVLRAREGLRLVSPANPPHAYGPA
jgi:DNA-binding MarR family transcriptional regulator